MLCAPSYPASQFEIIAVDNGSSDGTAEIARRFGRRVISVPRKGVAYARQTGFEAARGTCRFSLSHPVFRSSANVQEGYLDDLLLVPPGIAVVRKMIPQAMWDECREKAQEALGQP